MKNLILIFTFLISPFVNGQITFQEVISAGGFTLKNTVDGGFIVSGVHDSNGSGVEDIGIAKLDSNGSMEWNRQFDTDAEFDMPFDIIQSSDGGYAIIGQARFSNPN